VRASVSVDPIRTLIGPNTGLEFSGGVALDTQGRMYVTTTSSNKVTVYAKNWANGDTAPIKTLSGRATGLHGPAGITFDAAGLMYVANTGLTNIGGDSTLEAPSVTVYAANWATGNTAPIRTLKGAATGLKVPSGVAIDSDGNLAVVNVGLDVPPARLGRVTMADPTFTPSVTTYAAGWRSGNTKPTKTLKGAATGLGISIGGIAFNSLGQLFVVNSIPDPTNFGPGSGTVTVYAKGYASGNTAPIKTLTGSRTTLFQPVGVAFDAAGRMLITNAGNPSVLVFGKSWRSGNTKPSATITTGALAPPEGLQGPAGIAIDTAGVLYIANLQSSSVVALPGPAVPANAPTNVKAVRTNATSNIGTAGDIVGKNIRVSWKASVPRNTPVTGYIVTCSKPGKVLKATVIAKATSVFLVGAGVGPYTCSVIATSAGGNSAATVVKNV